MEKTGTSKTGKKAKARMMENVLPCKQVRTNKFLGDELLSLDPGFVVVVVFLSAFQLLCTIAIWVPYSVSLYGFLTSVSYLGSLYRFLIQVSYSGSLFRFLILVPNLPSLFGFFILLKLPTS